MSFSTNATIQGDFYGTTKYDLEKKTYIFTPLGKAITVEKATMNIESKEVTLLLSYDYLGEPVTVEISRSELTDHALLGKLAITGADVSRAKFDTIVDTLRLQEHSMESNNIRSEKVYTHLGWKTMPVIRPNSSTPVKALCYRSHQMIGEYTARYTGDLKVTPMGDYSIWKNMVVTHVLGHTALEFTLIAALSAVVNGLISQTTTGENPIIHLYGLSGTGKTTAAILAASTAGEPFDGRRQSFDDNCIPKTINSVYGSWGATANAIITRYAGNRGCVAVLNELGKFTQGDVSPLIYNLSEGTDKARLTTSYATLLSEGYSTTFISVGEMSLLGQCRVKADGLFNRVMELDNKFTSTPSQSRDIKDICRKNNGWAAPMLAEYIIKSVGYRGVLDIYKGYRESLPLQWPDSPSKERFIEKFVALFMTTVDLAQQALGIAFNKDAILDFLRDYDDKTGVDRNSALSSYDILMSEFRTNLNNFYRNNSNPSNRESWGRIHMVSKEVDGRIVTEEYSVRKSIVEELLKDHGFQNKKTCIAAWEDAGLISRDKDRPTRSRKIDKALAPEEVYVFRVYQSEDASHEADDRVQNKESGEDTEKKVTRIPLKSNLSQLLDPNDDDDEEDKEGEGNDVCTVDAS